MRPPATTRVLARLALLAMLLLALAPALSRVLGSGDPQRLDGWSQLCTSLGLQWRSSAGSSTDHGLPGQPGSVHDGDCDYCPLAGSLPLPLRAAGLWPAPALPPSPPALAQASIARQACPTGLGSRGPPARA